MEHDSKTEMRPSMSMVSVRCRALLETRKTWSRLAGKQPVWECGDGYSTGDRVVIDGGDKEGGVVGIPQSPCSWTARSHRSRPEARVGHSRLCVCGSHLSGKLRVICNGEVSL